MRSRMGWAEVERVLERGVSVGEREHARAERVAGAVLGAGEAELGEGIEAAADGGAGEAGADAELRDGHLRRLRGEGLDDDEAAGERGHEVGIAGEDVERLGGGGLDGRDQRGSGCRRRGGGIGETRSGRRREGSGEGAGSSRVLF